MTTRTKTQSWSNLLLAIRLRIIWLLTGFLLVSAPTLQADQLTDLITGSSNQSELSSKKVIATDNSAQDDVNIATRLQEIFSELDELQNLDIAVSNGVVTLVGEVNSSTLETKAMQFARQVEGVVDVENEITINRRIQTRLIDTGEKMAALGHQLIAALPLLMIALAVFLLFWWMGRWLSRRQSLFQRISANAFIARLLGQISYLIFIVIGIVLALVLLDAAELIGTVMGAAGIVGLAVGIAVRDTVENYIASILLSLRNPFDVNDFVKIDHSSGTVKCLTSRATILVSPDGNHIRIPNAKVFKAIIVNYTRSPDRRFQFEVGVESEVDLASVQALALETLSNCPSILIDPKPMVIIDELSDSNVLICIYGWVDQTKHSFVKVRSEAIRVVKLAFDEAGVSIPEPVYTLKMQGTEQIEPKKTQKAQPTQRKDKHPEKRQDKQPDKQSGKQNSTVGQDVSVDHTVVKKIAEEQSKYKQENLLDPNARKEM